MTIHDDNVLAETRRLLRSTWRRRVQTLSQIARSQELVDRSREMLRHPIYRYGPGYFGCQMPDETNQLTPRL